MSGNATLLPDLLFPNKTFHQSAMTFFAQKKCELILDCFIIEHTGRHRAANFIDFNAVAAGMISAFALI
jgi:hypothetical protein